MKMAQQYPHRATSRFYGYDKIKIKSLPGAPGRLLYGAAGKNAQASPYRPSCFFIRAKARQASMSSSATQEKASAYPITMLPNRWANA